MKPDSPRDPATILTGIAERAALRKKDRPITKDTTPVLLDPWDDSKRAAPNALFRSALFPALNPKQKENRRFLDHERIFSINGLEVSFTGKQFDQSDLDVYLELLNIAREYPLGQRIRFSAYEILQTLGFTNGGKNHRRLHLVLTRLCGGVINVTDQKKRYFGQLIQGGIRDEVTLNYEISINPDFAKLFGLGMWSSVDKAQRMALSRNSTAKALQSYYATHVNPAPHKFTTLADIVGLTDKNPRKVKAVLINAHGKLVEVGFLVGFEVNDDNQIKACLKPSKSQLKHIAMKINGKG